MMDHHIIDEYVSSLSSKQRVRKGDMFRHRCFIFSFDAAREYDSQATYVRHMSGIA